MTQENTMLPARLTTLDEIMAHIEALGGETALPVCLHAEPDGSFCFERYTVVRLDQLPTQAESALGAAVRRKSGGVLVKPRNCA